MQDFLSDGKYLPGFLKDFHDQKAFFKRLDKVTQASNKKNTYIKLPNWIEGQCYTIDIFLWFLAQHGYTLQKSRKNIKFADIYKTMGDFEKDQSAQKWDVIAGLMGKDKVEKGEIQ